ncbi:MAG TPA: BrnA antitoxin family protein [Geminicoccaceae bacterium]
MKRDGHIVRYTSEELAQMRAEGKSQTDWARVDAMTEEELEAAIASDPDWADLPEDWVKHATAYDPRGPKKQVTLRLDPDVLAWFKARGAGYQTRINAALRAFVEAHRQKP